MTTVEILTEARKLIEKPEAWTKGAFARDRNGNSALTWSPEAVCFCSVGALLRVGPPLEERCLAEDFLEEDFLERAVGIFAISTFAGWQDAPERTHAEVLNAFSRAIELAGVSQ